MIDGLFNLELFLYYEMFFLLIHWSSIIELRYGIVCPIAQGTMYHEILKKISNYNKGNTSKRKTFFTRNKHQFDLILCVLILQYFFISTFYESRKWYQIVVWTVFEVHINVLQNNNDLANGYFICYAMCHSVTV